MVPLAEDFAVLKHDIAWVGASHGLDGGGVGEEEVEAAQIVFIKECLDVFGQGGGENDEIDTFVGGPGGGGFEGGDASFVDFVEMMDGGNQDGVGGGDDVYGHIVAVEVEHGETGCLNFVGIDDAGADAGPGESVILVFGTIEGWYFDYFAGVVVLVAHKTLDGEGGIGVDHLSADLPGAEIDDGLVLDIVDGEGNHCGGGKEEDDGIAFETAPTVEVACQEDPDGGDVEGYVLPKGLPVGEFDCVAETAAVGDFVGNGIDEGGAGEEEHHQGQEPGGEAAEGVGEEQDAYEELGRDQGHSEGSGEGEGPFKGEGPDGPCGHILLDLEGGAHGVDSLHEAGENKYETYNPAAKYVEGVFPISVLHFRSI